MFMRVQGFEGIYVSGPSVRSVHVLLSAFAVSNGWRDSHKKRGYAENKNKVANTDTSLCSAFSVTVVRQFPEEPIPFLLDLEAWIILFILSVVVWFISESVEQNCYDGDENQKSDCPFGNPHIAFGLRSELNKKGDDQYYQSNEVYDS
jgi:hypothetical protein